MNKLAGFLGGVLRDLTRDRAELVKENALLRTQVQAYKVQSKRPRLDAYDRALLVFLAGLVPRWRELLTIVTPDTLVRWSNEGFRAFWARISSRGRRKGRRKLSEEAIALMHRLALETTWGAKRIAGELKAKLHVRVHKSTVQKVLRRERPPRPRGQSWSTFMRNHVDVAWASDFFTVPTLWFGQLHVFFVMKLGTREILQWNVTWHPTAAWTAQQLKNVLSWSGRELPEYFVRDQDAKYGGVFDEILQGSGIEAVITSHPTENAIAERFVGTVRREVLKYFVVLGEKHLRWILSEFIDGHYNLQRPHQGLGQAIPAEIEKPVRRRRHGRVVRKDVLNGIIAEYRRVA